MCQVLKRKWACAAPTHSPQVSPTVISILPSATQAYAEARARGLVPHYLELPEEERPKLQNTPLVGDYVLKVSTPGFDVMRENERGTAPVKGPACHPGLPAGWGLRAQGGWWMAPLSVFCCVRIS